MFQKFINFFKLDISGNRVFGLDLLRSIAILLVLIAHSREYLPILPQKIINLFLVDGVAIFFVLSGFLIGTIIIKTFEKELSLKSISNFWKRRWLRTLPNYYLILTVLYILSLSKYDEFISLPEFIKYIFFSQNLFYPIGDFFPESWSLSVEEWFYTITPILLFLIHLAFGKKIIFKKQLLSLIISIIISVTLYRAIKYFNLENKNYYIYDRYFLRYVFARIDAIMFGVLGAWLCYYHTAVFYRGKKILFWLGAITLIITHNFESLKDPFLYILSFTSTSLGVLLMLPMMSSWKSTTSSLRTPIVYCSLISYSMYLVNLSLIGNTLKSLSIQPSWKFILFWILTILISITIYKYFEVPIMKWRDRITRK